jgi:ABC-type glycerol-3-phosphate transport system substrate-binding protein
MLKSYLTAKDGKYYMLPFYDGFYGFMYDVELFEEESFYFDDEGAFIGLERGADATARAAFEADKSNGPDGKENTYDDGLPATYTQMLELVDQIKLKGYIPFCYAGSTEYVDKAFRGYVVDYEGYEGMKVNYTLSGKANVVTSISGDTVTTEEITVTQENAYELQKQAGKYYALKMEETLFGSTAYTGGQFNEDAHTTAQRTFINSKYATSGRYAMLAEGAWWENEAELANAFSGVEKRADRRFAFLPVPKADSSRAGDQTMISLNNSYAFINKDSQNMEAAKEFMRFLHTDSEMSKFTARTSITRSLSYSILEEDRSTATNFGKSLIDMRSKSNVVYPYSSVKLVLDNADAFSEIKWFSTTRVGSTEYTSPMLAFQAENPVSAKAYFDGLYTFQQNQWSILK